MEKQLNFPVKVFHSDSGTEYCNHDLQTFFNTKGIHFRPSHPYEHQQNGIAESAMRVSGERMLACQVSTRLPRELWPWISSFVTYIHNFSPVKKHSEFPFSKFFKRRFSVQHLVVKLIPCSSILCNGDIKKI